MNIYQPTKVALSFCLAPDFLPEVESPKKPFGMFFIISPCPPCAPIVYGTLTRTLRQQVPQVPYLVQGRRARRYPYHHVEEQGVRVLSHVCLLVWLTMLLNLKELLHKPVHAVCGAFLSMLPEAYCPPASMRTARLRLLSP